MYPWNQPLLLLELWTFIFYMDLLGMNVIIKRGTAEKLTSMKRRNTLVLVGGFISWWDALDICSQLDPILVQVKFKLVTSLIQPCTSDPHVFPKGCVTGQRFSNILPLPWPPLMSRVGSSIRLHLQIVREIFNLNSEGLKVIVWPFISRFL